MHIIKRPFCGSQLQCSSPVVVVALDPDTTVGSTFSSSAPLAINRILLLQWLKPLHVASSWNHQMYRYISIQICYYVRLDRTLYLFSPSWRNGQQFWPRVIVCICVYMYISAVKRLQYLIAINRINVTVNSRLIANLFSMLNPLISLSH